MGLLYNWDTFFEDVALEAHEESSNFTERETLYFNSNLRQREDQMHIRWLEHLNVTLSFMLSTRFSCIVTPNTLFKIVVDQQIP